MCLTTPTSGRFWQLKSPLKYLAAEFLSGKSPSVTAFCIAQIRYTTSVAVDSNHSHLVLNRHADSFTLESTESS